MMQSVSASPVGKRQQVDNHNSVVSTVRQRQAVLVGQGSLWTTQKASTLSKPEGIGRLEPVWEWFSSIQHLGKDLRAHNAGPSGTCELDQCQLPFVLD